MNMNMKQTAIDSEDGRSTATVTAYRRLCSSEDFRALIHAKQIIVGALLFVSLGFFLGMTLLAGFARTLMTSKIFGVLNLGFSLIILAYFLCWAVALIYVRVANGTFDRRVEVMLDVRTLEGRQG